MQRSCKELHGFEKDINKLIDAYALQAELEQSLSYLTFKRLFKAGGYAYLHQVYPGCEHSPEFTQLLFAAALDRLDVVSPTAPPESPLWLMHVDRAAAAAAMQATAGTTAAQKAAQNSAAAAQAISPCIMHHSSSVNSFATNNANNQPSGSSHSGGVVVPLQQYQQQHLLHCSDWDEQVPAQQPKELHAQQHQQLQHRHTHMLQQGLASQQLHQQHQDIPDSLQEAEQQQQQVLSQGHQHQWKPVELAQQLHLQHNWHEGQEQQQQLSCAKPVQQQQQEVQVSEGAAQQQMQQHVPHHVCGVGLQQQQHSEELVPKADPQLHVPHSLRPLQETGRLMPQQQQQGQQRQEHQGLAVMLPSPQAAAASLCSLDDELDDDFLNDLLAIFDEAEGLSSPQYGVASRVPQLQLEQASAAGAMQQVASDVGAEPDNPAAAPTSQQQRRPPPAMSVPLAVKAAVVFTLHCLFETQLCVPKVCIYTSLQHLQQLNAAAAQFGAAGAAAVDAVVVLHQLLKQQRLLVGQFRRPVQWTPQLPAWLAPPPPKWPDLGLGSAAANRAAARAGGEARVAAVMSVANIASSLRDHNPKEVDPVVHRDAMFHIKTALRSLANFKSLQALCSKYTDARRAIFEPLLKIKEPIVEQSMPPAAAAAAGINRPQLPEQQQKGTKRRPDGKGTIRKRGKLASTGTQPQPTRSSVADRSPQLKSAAVQAAAAAAAGVPELFDRNFGHGLAQLANDEAVHMLMLLDPAQNPQQAKRKLKDQQRAAKQAAAADTGRGQLPQLKKLAGDAGAKASAQQQKRSRQLAAGDASNETVGLQSVEYTQELLDAGIINAAELKELQENDTESQRSVPSFGAASQVLKMRQQARQHALATAEQWFRSHDAMLHMGDDYEGEDMP